jgi:DNA polymerase elongation subunit (family B)
MDPLLYGHNSEEGIVAAQHVGDNAMRIYVRRDGGTDQGDVEFFPFFLLSDESYLTRFAAKYWIKELGGSNFFRYLCAFSRWSEMWEALRHAMESYNSTAVAKIDSVVDLPVVHFRTDPVSQFLMQSGKTLFKGMGVSDLHRLQIEIAWVEAGQPIGRDPTFAEEHIACAALSDNRGWTAIIDTRTRKESEVLEEVVQIVKRLDPDVLEGHHLSTTGLAKLLRRCEALGIEMRIGRDGTTPRTIETRVPVLETDAAPFEVAGRHIVDTAVLAQQYDVAKRRIENFEIQHVADFFGLQPFGKPGFHADRLHWHWSREPETVLCWAQYCVRAVRDLCEILLPSAISLAQMVPMSLGAVIRSGAATKIESLLLREYLRQRRSVPMPQVGVQTAGGYSDIFHRGVFGPVLHVDVESLYPSIIISEGISPRSDDLGIFVDLLERLKNKRLEAKEKAARTEHGRDRLRLDAAQSSLKILINAFYGYLGYPKGLFNDFKAADRIATQGQAILRGLIEQVALNGGKVIEVDTDGIYCVPPSNGKAGLARFVQALEKKLPQGIRLTVAGKHKKMLSYKVKNYALLDEDDGLILKGSSLISRSMEPFARRYLRTCIECLLRDDLDGLHRAYANTCRDLMGHRIPIRELVRTETLNESYEDYEKAVEAEKRNRAASYQSAIAGGIPWRPGLKVSYYITGEQADAVAFQNCKLVEQWDANFPDENIAYYVKRLKEFSKRLEDFFLAQDFHAIFSPDDLFGFSGRGVPVLSTPVHERKVESDEGEEQTTPEISIWLDEG